MQIVYTTQVPRSAGVCVHTVMAESSGDEMHFKCRGSRFC